MKTLALIPARGGSKGFPGKNLARLGGRPMLAYTIEAARRAKGVTRVLVSTDSPEIAAAARRLGAEAPFLRPKAIAGDRSPVMQAVLHALDWLEEREGWKPERLLLLQPTSPLRGRPRVEQALRLLSRADTVVGVSKPPVHPWRCVRFEKGRMSFAVPRPKRRLERQDFPEFFAINGSLYLTRTETVRKGGLYGRRVLPLVMEPWESVDVDEPSDLALAEHYLRLRR